MKLNPEIFREYDIRGLVNKEITEEFAETLGKAFGTYIKKGTVTVGGDVRQSTVSYKKALIKGLLSAGINIIDVGICPTPALYFSIYHFRTDGGIMITASHNPKEYNGFKLCIREAQALYGKEIQKIRAVMERGKFLKGKGSLKKKEIIPDYIEDISSRIRLSKKIKVVIDAGNGNAGNVAPELLKKIGCDVTCLYCELDGNFPNHIPDPVNIENIKELIRKVKELKADLGVGYDGDCDRIGAVDDKGNVVWGDKLLALFSRELLKEKPKSKIIFEVKCSQALEEDIKAHDGIPIMWKTGHSLIKAKMRKEKALLAGEMSGHMFFADNYYGYDDAIFASCKLIELLSKTNKKFSELLASLPYYYATPEIRINCSDNEKFKIIKKLKEYFKKKFKIIDVDGVRVIFKDGWGLVRASNTQPKIILRFEAKTKPALKEIKSIILNKLMEFPSLRKEAKEMIR